MISLGGQVNHDAVLCMILTFDPAGRKPDSNITESSQGICAGAVFNADLSGATPTTLVGWVPRGHGDRRPAAGEPPGQPRPWRHPHRLLVIKGRADVHPTFDGSSWSEFVHCSNDVGWVTAVEFDQFPGDGHARPYLARHLHGTRPSRLVIRWR